jgi:hypothetical protein
MFACPAAASPLCRRKVPFGRAGLLGMGEVRTREFRGVGNMGTIRTSSKEHVDMLFLVSHSKKFKKGLMCGRLRAYVVIDEMMREDEGLRLEFRVILWGIRLGDFYQPERAGESLSEMEGVVLNNDVLISEI